MSHAPKYELTDEDRKFIAKVRRNNILITPIVLFVRLPIMLVGMPMAWLGNLICRLGDRIPGWRRP